MPRIALTDSPFPFLEVTASEVDVCLVLVDAEGEEAAGLCIHPADVPALVAALQAVGPDRRGVR